MLSTERIEVNLGDIFKYEDDFDAVTVTVEVLAGDTSQGPVVEDPRVVNVDGRLTDDPDEFEQLHDLVESRVVDWVFDNTEVVLEKLADQAEQARQDVARDVGGLVPGVFS